MAKKIVYITSKELRQQCDMIEVIKNRSAIVHSLIKSYGLLNDMLIKTKHPRKITVSELADFHSSDYIDYLKSLPETELNNTSINSSTISNCSDGISDKDLEFGIGYDCPKLDNLLNFALTIAGGTVSAAECLLNDEADIAINWCGGWHHAKRDAAAGFCYVNDIVLGIEKLKEKFKRILYIDLDVHHGDGVEEAFFTTQKVLTLSFHVHERGFFPGSGGVESIGMSNGKGYTINAPYNFNIIGSQFVEYFCDVFEAVNEFYKPDVYVIQCGADVLSGDPLGGANLTIKDMSECIKIILNKTGPKMFVGGGGYNPVIASKYWTSLTAMMLGKELDEDIPDHDYFLKYGPCYTINMERKQLKDFNTKEKLRNNYERIREILMQNSKMKS